MVPGRVELDQKEEDEVRRSLEGIALGLMPLVPMPRLLQCPSDKVQPFL